MRLPNIKAQMTVPLIADIHFDHRLALKAAEVVDCIRINPGNIGPWWKTEEVIKAVNDHGIPLRVGGERWFPRKAAVGQIWLSHGRSPLPNRR